MCAEGGVNRALEPSGTVETHPRLPQPAMMPRADGRLRQLRGIDCLPPQLHNLTTLEPACRCVAHPPGSHHDDTVPEVVEDRMPARAPPESVLRRVLAPRLPGSEPSLL